MDNRETKSHGSLSFPAELYHVDQSHIRYQMSCHWHPEHELIRVISGELEVSLNEASYHLEAGDFVFVPGGTLLRGEPNECVYECIVFDPVGLCGEKEICRTLLRDGLAGVSPAFYPAENTAFSSLALPLFEALASETEPDYLTAKGYMFALLGYIANANCRQSTETTENTVLYSKLKQALTLIQSQYAAPLSLSQLADAAELSPHYFCRSFKKIIGLSPMEYLIRYRLECAVFYLTQTTKSITDIGFACGFNDLSHFIHTFKKHTSLSPRAFRNR